MLYHAIAILSGDRQKTIPNKTEDEILSSVVIPFVASGVVTAKWGAKTQSYQVIELRIFQSAEKWDKRKGPLIELLKGKKNLFNRFGNKAKVLLATNKPKVFVVTPIQGEKHGDQEQQRIFREYDERFSCIEGVIAANGGIAIRIDKEYALDDLVGRIKKEIRGAVFVVADLTDERPSCYFEAGYAEALEKSVIYIASKQSVEKPGTKTRIHFDIHMGVHYFSNLNELGDKLGNAINKNREQLFGSQ